MAQYQRNEKKYIGYLLNLAKDFPDKEYEDLLVVVAMKFPDAKEWVETMLGNFTAAKQKDTKSDIKELSLDQKLDLYREYDCFDGIFRGNYSPEYLLKLLEYAAANYDEEEIRDTYPAIIQEFYEYSNQ